MPSARLSEALELCSNMTWGHLGLFPTCGKGGSVQMIIVTQHRVEARRTASRPIARV